MRAFDSIWNGRIHAWTIVGQVLCFVLLLSWIGWGCVPSGRIATADGATSESQSAETPALDRRSLIERGDSLYTSVGCNACHALDGQRRVGPSFRGLYGTVDHEMNDGTTITVDAKYLRESIRNPGAMIVKGYSNLQPAFPSLTEREVTALVAFIKAQSEKSVPKISN